MYKYLLLIYLPVLFLSCQYEKDPIIKSLRQSNNIDQFVQNIDDLGLINKTKDEVENGFIKTRFDINLNKSRNLKYNLVINPDGYLDNKVRELYIKIPFENFISKMEDSILTKQQFLLQKYKSYYGDPDTLVLNQLNRQIFKQISDNQMNFFEANEPIPDTKVLIWELEDYTINLALPKISKVEKTVLSYRIKKFDKITTIVKDSLESNYSVEDLLDPYNLSTGLSLDLNNSINLSLYAHGLTRRNSTDIRSITNVRFDAKIIDAFGETLFTKKDITLELPIPLTKEDAGSEPTGNRFNLENKYDLRDKSYKKLLWIINYKKNNMIKTVTDNFRVTLDDGTIITANKTFN